MLCDYNDSISVPFLFHWCLPYYEITYHKTTYLIISKIKVYSEGIQSPKANLL